MTAMTIAVCDDEKIQCATIEKYIHIIAQKMKIEMHVRTFQSGEALLKEKVSEYDLCILDIEMPRLDGMEVARRIQETNEECKIAFVSHHDELVQEGYRVRAYRFLYKPIQGKQLKDLLEDVVCNQEKKQGIFVTNSKSHQCIKFCDISHIESLGDGIAISAKGELYTERRSLKLVSTILDERFFQCHKSYIINFDDVDKILYGEGVVQLHGGKKIPIAQRKKTALKNAYMKRIRERARYS